MKREIKWEVGYDHRNDPAKKQYGCHGMQIRFLLHGEKATVQFLLYTGWLPTWKQFEHNPLAPLPADVGYHADVEQYEDQDSMECDYRPGGKCYYDGSGLMADDAFKILVKNGEEALWQHLEAYYRERFETADAPAIVGGTVP